MKRDAEEHAAADLKKAELVKVRNLAESTAFQIEQQLSEHGDKVPAEDRSKVEAAINNVREVIKGDEAEAITKANEQLMQDAQAIGKVVYEEAAKAQSAGAAEGSVPPGGDPGATKPDDADVIDAEFEVKDAK